ncbi:hypothetical protein [Spirosoma luteum]|uniref:hypothetical protein n=1 Tax=Spirosoma luteum TaxID=431553 RepID=UPI00035C1D88|nr:hypothetical protein [Spirosoma luteum]
MKKSKTKIEIKPASKEVDQLLTDIYNGSVSTEEQETAHDTLRYYAKREIPVGYLLHTADIVAKTKTGFSVEVLIEKESGGIGS